MHRFKKNADQFISNTWKLNLVFMHVQMANCKIEKKERKKKEKEKNLGHMERRFDFLIVDKYWNCTEWVYFWLIDKILISFYVI